MLRLARHWYWILQTQAGIDPLVMLRSIRGVGRYVRDWIRFRAGYRSPMTFRPCLQDWRQEGGATNNEYFWQDLLVAQKIFQAGPERHVDVGSRVDGFVAHLATFRDIEVLDVRPITSTIPGVAFRQADMMKGAPDMESYCDSLSCLHALEHFGLGRYGDPIDPDGHSRGVANLAALLREGGRLYLSVPVGRERVEFNAGRVFDPRTILHEAGRSGLSLEELSVVVPTGIRGTLEPTAVNLAQLATEEYAVGVFVFTKVPVASGSDLKVASGSDLKRSLFSK